MDAHKQRLGVLDGPWRRTDQLRCFQKTFCCIDGVVASLYGSTDQSRGTSDQELKPQPDLTSSLFSGTYGATPSPSRLRRINFGAVPTAPRSLVFWQYHQGIPQDEGFPNCFMNSTKECLLPLRTIYP